MRGSLLKAARAENDAVVMSLFVSRTQFKAGGTSALTPATRSGTPAIAESSGVDFIFYALPDDVYLRFRDQGRSRGVDRSALRQ